MSTTPVRFLPLPVRRRQAGLSLIELMVSLTIGLLLLAGMLTLIVGQSRARAEIDKSSRQIENGRYALTILEDDIQHAGYYGQYSGVTTPLTALPDPCAVDATTLDAALAMPLQGYDAPAAVPAPLSACLADANHVAGTDILVVRRVTADDSPVAVASAVAGQVYVQTTPDAKITALGADTNPGTPAVYTLKQKDGVTPADLRAYVEHIYYISPCNVYAAGLTTCSADADQGRPIPTLKRLELTVIGGAAGFTTIPLVDGIQNLQLDYGVAASASGTPSSSYTTAPAVADWPNVMAVQVSLLARTTEPSAGYVDGRAYNMGAAGSVGPFSDAYKRHVYTALVRAINLSSRRE
ncbi:MAG: pilus assembly protein PilW [Burkholderia sp.]|nr:pilus assembly protein PilW [Burkholderia sp.]